MPNPQTARSLPIVSKEPDLPLSSSFLIHDSYFSLSPPLLTVHTRDDLSCTRGYELFLIKEAKARNPNIITYGLSWGLPAWVGNNTYYSSDNIFYQTQWVDCINKEAGVVVDYLGL